MTYSQVLTCLNSTASLFSFNHNKVIKPKLIFSQRKRKTGTKHRSDTLFYFTIIQIIFTWLYKSEIPGKLLSNYVKNLFFLRNIGKRFFNLSSSLKKKSLQESPYPVHLSEQQNCLEILLLYHSVHPSTSQFLQSPKPKMKNKDNSGYV